MNGILRDDRSEDGNIKQNGEVPRTSPHSGVENPLAFLWSFYCRLIVPAFSQQVFFNSRVMHLLCQRRIYLSTYWNQ